MPEYNDEEYLRYSSMLDTAVWGLMDNDISEEGIREMVQNAVDGWEDNAE